ncbi:MAG TPA: sulfatase-like hydrolase/transferase [Acidobacteriota bacterium]
MKQSRSRSWRSWRFHFFLPAVALLLFASAPLGAQNVVLITVDTLRSDHLEVYGYANGKTPAITSLAREGVLVENVIVQTPITLPSHATILTGTYPFYHGVQDVVGRLRNGVPTLAEWFKQRGYATAAFVGSSVLSSAWGLNRGFDVYDDQFPSQGLRQIDFDRLERPAAEVIFKALQWLDKNQSRKFFLWVHLYDPHDPYVPPAPFSTEFRERPYDGEIAYVDASLDNFFKTLRQRRLFEDSLVVFTADHGESLGEHKEAHHGFFIYEASLRVPLILKFPQSYSGAPRNSRSAGQMRSVDIAPTLLQILGEKVPAGMQGEGRLAVLTGKRGNPSLPAYAETHYPRVHFGWSPLFSYSTADSKFIDAPVPEFYDLKKDPGELRNIYKENKALADRMREELRALQRKYGLRDPRPGASDAESVDPETMERLKSLGYVGFSAGSIAGAAGLADPKDKVAIYNQLNRAITLSRRGRSDLAISAFNKVAEEEPTMPVVHFLLGSEYFSMSQYLKAIEQFNETLKFNPSSNVARFSLARAYSQAGLDDKADKTVREVLSTEPKHMGARHLLATVLGKQGKFQEAAAEELKALEVRPSFAEGHNNLGSYYMNLGQLDKAVASYQKALEYAPNFVHAQLNLSLAYYKLGRYDQALAQARTAAALAPNSSIAHFYTGQAYLAKGMKAEARESFKKAAEIDPKIRIPQF